jgi:hypothetical protein
MAGDMLNPATQAVDLANAYGHITGHGDYLPREQIPGTQENYDKSLGLTAQPKNEAESIAQGAGMGLGAILAPEDAPVTIASLLAKGGIGMASGASAQGASDAVPEGHWYSNAAKTAAGAVGGFAGGLGTGTAVGRLERIAAGQAPEDAARSLLTRSMARDKVAPDDASQQLTGTDKPLSVMDVAGQSAKRLGRGLTVLPGEAGSNISDFLYGRSEDQPSRITSDVSNSLSNTHDVYGISQDLMKQRSAAAKPLYDAAMDAPPAISPRLERFAKDPTVQKGMQEGMRIARLEALANDEPFDPSQYGFTEGYTPADKPTGILDSSGRPIMKPSVPVMPDVPNWRAWQAAKVGLDNIVEQQRDPVTGRLQLDPEGRAVNNVRASLLDELDAQNPLYAKARAAWAGPSQSNDALMMGKSILRRDPEQIQQAVGKLSDSDKPFYQVGATRAIIDKINAAGDNADLTKRIANTPRSRAQITAAFGPDKANQLFDALNSERTMSQTKQSVLGNSTTANKFADVDDLTDNSHPMLADAAKGFIAGGPKGAAIMAGMGAATRYVKARLMFRGVKPDTANALANMLTSTGPEGAETLRNLGNAQPVAPTTLGSVARGIGLAKPQAASAPNPRSIPMPSRGNATPRNTGTQNPAKTANTNQPPRVGFSSGGYP